MHDCRQTQESLIELIFDGAEGCDDGRAPLLAEVERCPACTAEYRALASTLAACDEATDALAPADAYWPRYHASLTRRLRAAAAADRPAPASRLSAKHLSSTRSIPFWKRALGASVRVPVPLAAVALLLLFVACGVALSLAARPAPEPVPVAAPPVPEVAPQIRFVEVPVVERKTVTQIIYLPRHADEEATARRPAARENLAGVRRQNTTAGATNTAAASARAKLSGFKPAGEVNLRIIKGSDAREQ